MRVGQNENGEEHHFVHSDFFNNQPPNIWMKITTSTAWELYEITIKVLLSIYFPDDVVEAYNLIKDLEPTTPQVTYVPLDYGFDFSVIAKTVA